MAWVTVSSTRMRARMVASRREQALLALLPGLPRGPALARGLSWCAWRRHRMAFEPSAWPVGRLAGVPKRPVR